MIQKSLAEIVAGDAIYIYIQSVLVFGRLQSNCLHKNIFMRILLWYKKLG